MDKQKMDEPTTKLRAMKLEDTTKEDTIMDDPTKDDTDDTDDPNTQDPEGTEEAEKIEEEEEPLEIGGFLTLLHDHDYLTMTTPPFNPSNPITPPPTTSTSTSISNPKPPPPPTPPSSYNTTNVQARDLSPGHAILFQGRPVEITARTDRLMRSGPLASRHRVRFSLVELFDKEVVVVGMGEGKGEGLGVGKGEGKGKGEREEAGLDVKATEWLKRVGSERVRYSLISLEGPNQDIMMMETQHRDEAKKKTVAFRIPARGKLGTQLLDFLAVCEEREDRAGMPVTVLLLEAVGLFQLIGLGVGDWEALG